VDRLWKDEGKKEENKNGLEKVEIESAVESINDAMEHINRALRFSIHEDTQRVMVKVVNIRTDEVIKELPPEDVLDTVARIREMIGLLIDERA
jgi:flagellar protein FlaG